MYYNRNLITTEQHPTDGSEASGVFDLATQAYSQSKKDWPIPDDDFDIAFRIEPGNPVTVSIQRHTLGPVTYTVDWGDGTGVSTETDVTISHDYSSGGIYIIKLTRVSGAAYVPLNLSHVYELTGVYANNNYNTSTGKIQLLDKIALKFLAIPFGVFANATDFNSQFRFCTSLKEFPLVDVSSGTNFSQAWFACFALRSFPALSFNSATNFSAAWERCYSLQAFPLITNTSGVTNFDSAWEDCTSLVSFPLIDTSGGTSFYFAWNTCLKLTSFPSINTGNGTNFEFAWQTCSKLTTFPSLNFGSGTRFRNAWQHCSALANFPADMFDSTGTLASNAFFKTFENCSLTAQSIENILTSLDTNGATGIQLHINGGSNASYSTWSQAAKDALTSLQGKSWSVTYNS
jgi:hypothetical protein|tara:strand:- start:307 stop:1515 length:1209 start_codon:yes stop_codon:yes gene_type:complete